VKKVLLTSKQRSYLKSLAQKQDAILQIGKGGITPAVTEAVDEALERRELIKLAVLNNAPEDVQAAADILAGRTRSSVVQTIGKKIVLYRVSKTHHHIGLEGR
jgi:RNA-binding protein